MGELAITVSKNGHGRDIHTLPAAVASIANIRSRHPINER